MRRVLIDVDDFFSGGKLLFLVMIESCLPFSKTHLHSNYWKVQPPTPTQQTLTFITVEFTSVLLLIAQSLLIIHPPWISIMQFGQKYIAETSMKWEYCSLYGAHLITCQYAHRYLIYRIFDRILRIKLRAWEIHSQFAGEAIPVFTSEMQNTERRKPSRNDVNIFFQAADRHSDNLG